MNPEPPPPGSVLIYDRISANKRTTWLMMTIFVALLTVLVGVIVLAMGGGCGFRDNNFGQYVELNDPKTLNPQEEKQCAAWWDRIVGAETQAVWRETRALYEFNCLKPLEKKAVQPPPPK